LNNWREYCTDGDFELCQLGEFPKIIVTNKMQQLVLAAPMAANGKHAVIKVLNARTGAAYGEVVQAEKSIKITDAGNNETDYTLFYINNKVADSGTNRYEIYYELVNNVMESGGNS
jgi:hypothetical protein